MKNWFNGPVAVVGNATDSWFTPGRFAAILGLLIIAMYPDVIFGTRTFFFRDFEIFAYPWAHYHRESFWRGEIPLWNPLSNCGIPFLAQWNTMTLYPPALFYLLLPLSWSLGVFCLLHLFLGGMGMYFLAHHWVGNRWAASLAGVAFAFNGLMLNSLMWTNNIAALGWMPWVIWLAQRGWNEGRKCVIQAALVGALQMLAGAPEIIILTWVLVGAFWMAEWLQNKALRARIVGRFLVMVTLVAGLASVQLLPFLDLIAHSQRDRHFGADIWPMPLWGAANFLVPLFFTFPWAENVFFQYDQYWTSSYYVGLGIFVLAMVALWNTRQPRVWILGGILVLGVMLAMGEKALLYGWLKQLVPAFGIMRYPIKFVVLAVFVLPLLAAFAGTSASVDGHQRWSLVIGGLAGLTGIAFILWYARFHPLYEDEVFNHWPATLHNGWTRAMFAIAFLGGLLALPWVRRARSRVMIQVALLLLAWLDVYSHAPRQNPTIPRWVYDPLPQLRQWAPVPKHGKARAMPSATAEYDLHTSRMKKATDDFVLKRAGLYCNCNLLDSIPKVNGVFSLHLREAEEVNELLYGSTNREMPNLVDFLNVSQITAPGRIIEWRARTTYLPLISSGQVPAFAGDDECLRVLASTEVDPRKLVYLPAEARLSVSETNGSVVRIVSQRVKAHRVDLQVEGKGLLVISQSYYHPWRAQVDGQPVPLWRANHAFQALEIPAGRHKVILVYEDRLFTFGAGISALVLLGCLLSLLLKRFRTESRCSNEIPNCRSFRGGDPAKAIS